MDNVDAQDQDLLARYRDGDVQALSALVERYRRPLYGYIMNMVQDSVEADEVFQEVWFRAIKRLDRYKAGNFGGWLMRIGRNYVIDRARKRRPVVEIASENDRSDPLDSRFATAEPGPSDNTLARELGKRIAMAVSELPHEQREVFVMRVHAELPFKEIANIQSVSINTALARMQYALEKLRVVLKTDYEQLGR